MPLFLPPVFRPHTVLNVGVDFLLGSAGGSSDLWSLELFLLPMIGMELLSIFSSLRIILVSIVSFCDIEAIILLFLGPLRTHRVVVLYPGVLLVDLVDDLGIVYPTVYIEYY